MDLSMPHNRTTHNRTMSTSSITENSFAKSRSRSQQQTSENTPIEIFSLYCNLFKKNIKNLSPEEKKTEQAHKATINKILKEYEKQNQQIIDYKEDITEKTEQINRLKHQLHDLNTEISNLKRQKTNLVGTRVVRFQDETSITTKENEASDMNITLQSKTLQPFKPSSVSTPETKIDTTSEKKITTLKELVDKLTEWCKKKDKAAQNERTKYANLIQQKATEIEDRMKILTKNNKELEESMAKQYAKIKNLTEQLEELEINKTRVFSDDCRERLDESNEEYNQISQFNEQAIQKMSAKETFEIYKSLTRKRRLKDTLEANKYLQYLRMKIDESVNHINKLKEEIIQNAANYNTLHQVTLDKQQKIEELQNIIAQKQYEIDNHKTNETAENYKIMLDETSAREQGLDEKLKELQELLNCKEEELKNKNNVIQKYIQQSSLDIEPSNFQILLESIQSLSSQITKEVKKVPNITEQQQDIAQTNINKEQQIQSYAAVIQIPSSTEKISQKMHHKYSKAAILIRRRQNTSITLNEMRKILTRETKNIVKDQQIYCELARDRNTLVIKTHNDEATQKLLEAIENINSLRDIMEITFKSMNLRKIILLGIPTEYDPEEVIQQLQEKYITEIPISLSKKIYREGAQFYQLVLEVESWLSSQLIKQQKINLGFNTCRISLYMPLVRCQNCQRFGHTKEHCRLPAVCNYCAKEHKSNTCPLITGKKGRSIDKNKFRCLNCLNTPNFFPHEASSPDCPAFHYYTQQRNILSKGRSVSSTQ